MTAGTRTSEFAIAVIILAAATVMLALGAIDKDTWVELVKWVGGGYILSRGLSKVTTGGDRVTSTTESIIHKVEDTELQ